MSKWQQKWWLGSEEVQEIWRWILADFSESERLNWWLDTLPKRCASFRGIQKVFRNVEFVAGKGLRLGFPIVFGGKMIKSSCYWPRSVDFQNIFGKIHSWKWAGIHSICEMHLNYTWKWWTTWLCVFPANMGPRALEKVQWDGKRRHERSENWLS